MCSFRTLSYYKPTSRFGGSLILVLQNDGRNPNGEAIAKEFNATMVLHGCSVEPRACVASYAQHWQTVMAQQGKGMKGREKHRERGRETGYPDVPRWPCNVAVVAMARNRWKKER